MSIADYLSPINPSGYAYIQEWQPDPNDETKIIGSWAEDGSEYEIVCPEQLRNCIMAMQNLLPYFLDFLKQRTKTA